MKTAKLAAMFFAVAVSGCAAAVDPAPAPTASAQRPAASAPAYLPMSYTVGIDPSVQATDVETVIEALQEWSVAVGVAFTPSLESCATSQAAICIAQGEQNVTVDVAKDALIFGSGPLGECHMTGGYGGAIVLHAAGDGVLGPDMFRSLVAHELGHAMGLQHTPGGLMSPAIGTQGVEPADVAQFVELHTTAVKASAPTDVL